MYHRGIRHEPNSAIPGHHSFCRMARDGAPTAHAPTSHAQVWASPARSSGCGHRISPLKRCLSWLTGPGISLWLGKVRLARYVGQRAAALQSSVRFSSSFLLLAAFLLLAVHGLHTDYTRIAIEGCPLCKLWLHQVNGRHVSALYATTGSREVLAPFYLFDADAKDPDNMKVSARWVKGLPRPKGF